MAAKNEPDESPYGGGSVPVPDPTRLTTDQIRQEVKSLRELLEARLECQEEIFATLEKRVDGKQVLIDVAIGHVRELVASNIEVVKGELVRLEEVAHERFIKIDTQFVERDKRTDQLSLADKTAVSAALQAAKEAVAAQNTSNSIAIAKSESSTADSIRQLQALFNTSMNSLNDRIDDIKSRQDKLEGRTSVSDPAVSDGIKQMSTMISDLSKSRDTQSGSAAGMGHLWGIILGAGGFLIAMMTLIIIIIRAAN